MKNQCLQDEGVDFSSGCMRAFVWDFEGSQRIPKAPNGVPWSSNFLQRFAKKYLIMVVLFGI